MKKYCVIILLVLLLPICCRAINYQKRIIESVNRSEYANALKYVERVDSISTAEVFVPIEFIDEFVEYTLTHKADNSVALKVLFWAASYYDLWGTLYSINGDTYDAAEYCFQRTAQCYAILDGQCSRNRVNALRNLLDLYKENAHFDKAETIGYQLFEIYNNSADTISAALILNELSLCYYRQGELGISDSLQTMCKDMVYSLSNLLLAHYIYITYAEQTAYFYFAMRDYARAEHLYLDLVQIISHNYSPEQAKLPLSMLNSRLGYIELAKGHWQQANTLLSGAQPILSAHRKQFAPQYIFNSIGLARMAFYHADFVAAENILSECLPEAHTIMEKDLQNSSSFTIVLDELSTVEYMLHRYDSALQHTSEVLDIYESLSLLSGENFFQYGLALLRKSLIESEMGNTDSVKTPLLKSYPILKKTTMDILNLLPSDKREEYWAINGMRFSSTYPQWFTYFYMQGADSVADWAYNNELFVKGQLLQNNLRIKNAILSSADTALIALLNKLSDIDQYIAQHTPDINTATLSPEMEKLCKKRSDIDRQLSVKSQLYQQYHFADWRDVQQTLGEHDCAIEFSNYPDVQGDKFCHKYIAVVVDKHCLHPYIVPLFTDTDFVQLSDMNPNLLYETGGTLLADCLQTKLGKYLHLDGMLYFAPSGIIHNIAIESLKTSDGRRLGEMYPMCRVSSTRECLYRTNQDSFLVATLYGGLQYNTSMAELIAESRKYTEIFPSLVRSADADGQPDRSGWRFLPNSQIEVNTIGDILKSAGLKVALFQGATGNEESFKALSGKGTQILHIATHGFYTPSSQTKELNVMLEKAFWGKTLDSTYVDPLSRCGIVFSGAANVYDTIPAGIQDGVLYAREIASLDLSKCDLLVLSACQTALGDITSEGVFGLQRAFKQAGVKTIIMTLWSVKDQPTQFFMTEFYRNLITLKQDKHTAFRNAQNATRKKYPEPVYWAGFIMLD